MLKREELTAEQIDQIVADARKAGYDFFLSAEEREASLNEALARYQPGDEAWVFAYGSLMWNPALEFAESQPCKVEGWRRSFCFWMPLGRGTPELPGLMLALERGGDCEGIAYRLAPDQVRSELAILWNREMLAGVYQPRWVPTTLRDGRTVTAVTFVVDTAHCQYCGDLPIERAAHHIAFAEGRRGACRDYLANTAAHARALGIHDPYIEELVRARRRAAGTSTSFRRCRRTPRRSARPELRASKGRSQRSVRRCSRCDIVAACLALVARWLALPPNLRGILWVGHFGPAVRAAERLHADPGAAPQSLRHGVPALFLRRAVPAADRLAARPLPLAAHQRGCRSISSAARSMPAA